MTNLTVRSFRGFFRAIHGVDPFPWQQRLVGRLHETGRWPEALDLPTGTGKTAAIDAAVFHLALEAGKPERRAPLRVLYVVDRRTIVDQAHDRAIKIQRALEHSTDPVLVAVKERLAALSRGGAPLAVALLRGGIARDDGWARAPDQPLVAVSTVDQVGSRLLFRGYGVSDSMRPIHAGLLANDALLLLDEVHLSNPFVETLEQLDSRYMAWAESPLPRRWQWVPMSATPRGARKDALRLDEEDEAHPVLRARLSAARPAKLRQVGARGEGDAAQRAFVSAICEEALPMARPGRTAAVVVNRVATARAVFVTLRERLADRADVWLLTGRMRPIERQELEERIRPRVGAGRTRVLDQRPAVVVATQCIEAGADLDFDGLVTECASLDALRQRFGRLNRFGEIRDAEGVVVVRTDALKSEDPIYGQALPKTWAYLSGLPEIDFGLERFRMPPKKDLAEFLPALEHAPVLLPTHLDAWVQTAPAPAVDPEVALWLHGPDRGQPEVQIVWRADISEEMLRAGADVEAPLERLESCPPSTPEALAVPISAARRWLAGGGEAPVPDVDGMQEEADQARTPRGKRALAWAGESSRIVEAREVRPGDTLVVPAEYGGLDHGSWAPESESPVVDLGDRAAAIRRGRAVLRLNPSVMAGQATRAADGSLPGWASASRVPLADDVDARDDAIRAWLEVVIADGAAPKWMQEAARALARDWPTRRRPRIVPLPDVDGEAGYVALVGRAPLRPKPAETEDGPTTEDDSASFTGGEVMLRQHLRGVGAFARDYARRSGLPEERIVDVALAGALHDVGKADLRFQAMLRGGSAYAAEVAAEPLAKSAVPSQDRAAREAARARAGYPRGARHELVSLALIGASNDLCEQASDFDLVRHLVASHHGHCRPFAPFAEDPAPVQVMFTDGVLELRASSDHGLEAFDSGVSDRFWKLVRKYGWFGLAWLEATVRLADHRRSEQEQRGDEEGA